MASHAHIQVAPGERIPPQTKDIWRTFWILLIATSFEFAIAFLLGNPTLRVALFLGLTVIKAFYIVAHFMHLKDETKSLAWSIILPMVFVGWAIAVFLIEGEAIFRVR